MRAATVEWAFMLFEHVLVTTPVAAGLILLILFLRKRFVFRLPPQAIYTLWLLLIVRMMMPWTPPGPIQLWQYLFDEGPSSASSVIQKEIIGMKSIEENGNLIIQPLLYLNETSSAINVWELAAEIWGAVTVGLLLFYAGLCIYTYSVMRRTTCQKVPKLQLILKNCMQQLKLRRNVKIVSSSQVVSPALKGWIRPQILVPSQLIDQLDSDQWRNILLHELVHVRRGDIIWNHMMVLLAIVNWFNPLIWVAYRKMREDQEISCDHEVLRFTSQQQYGETLLRVAAWRNVKGSLLVDHGLPSFKGSSSRTLIRRRIEMIKHFSNHKRVWTPVFIGLLVLVAIMTFTGKSITALSQQVEREAQETEGEQLLGAMSFIIPAEGRTVFENEEKDPYVRIVNDGGTPVYAAADGIVEQAEYSSAEGNFVRIAHDDGYVTTYSHLESLDVTVGQQVSAGSKIGTIGSTGRSTGPHLKWIVLHNEAVIDPSDLLDK